MVKKVQSFHPEALITNHDSRVYLQIFESELLRGISTVVVLHLINTFPKEGIYAYKLLRTINTTTNNSIAIDEGTLYPLLKKMERDGVVISEKKKVENRTRNYYCITDMGRKLLGYMKGRFGKILDGISPLIDYQIIFPVNKYVICPNCANKIGKEHKSEFCEICGFTIEKLFSNHNLEAKAK